MLQGMFSLVIYFMPLCIHRGFPGGLDGEESACHVGDLGSISGLGSSPGEGNGYPLLYSCHPPPTPVFLPGKFHGQRGLAGYS